VEGWYASRAFVSVPHQHSGLSLIRRIELVMVPPTTEHSGVSEPSAPPTVLWVRSVPARQRPIHSVSVQERHRVGFDTLTVGYTGEQWRNGGNTAIQTLSFTYKIFPGSTFAGPVDVFPSGANGWTGFTALDFLTPVTGATSRHAGWQRCGEPDGDCPHGGHWGYAKSRRRNLPPVYGYR